RLDTAGVEADELTVHTPDLDDVFFALTDGTRVPHQADHQPDQQAQPLPSKEDLR
ncbi:ABC transporter, partial [Streptomyces sp. NPDC002690]